MCDVSMALGGVGTALTIGSQIGQASQARKLAEYNNRQTIASAKAAYLAENEALTAQAQEINQSAAEQSVDVARNALIQKARLRAASGESGLARSGAAGIRALDAALGTDLARLEAGRARQQRQIGRNRKTTKATYKQRTSNLQSGPSALSTGLQIGVTAAEGAYRGFQDMKKS